MGSKWQKTREYAEAIVIAVLLAVIIRTFIVQAFKIPSGSMLNTLQVGDHILVAKFSYGIKNPFTDRDLIHLRDPKRGDVIVFVYPVDPSKDFVKRIIGLPGDVVQIRDKKVFVNGAPLDEPYARFTDSRIIPASVSPRDNFGPVTVPRGQYLPLGDNRDESYDGRFWGFVDYTALKGQAFIIYWSWNSEGGFSLDPNDSLIRWNRLGKIIR